MKIDKNTKPNKLLSAVVIIASAVLFPMYFLRDDSLSLPTAEQWVLILLYLVFVAGFALMAVGVKIGDVTSIETDNKIKQKKAAFDKAIKPYLFLILLAIIMCMAYIIVDIKFNK